MADSSYYYDLMLKYGKEKRNLENKRDTYKNFIIKLNALKDSMDSPRKLLEGSYSYFKNGGFYDGGTPSRGKLLEVCMDIENVKMNLKNIIFKTEQKVSDFSVEIISLQKKYSEAERNYNNAKKE